MKVSELLKAHIVVGGQTESGKTYFATWLAKRVDRAIYVNPQHEDKPPFFFSTDYIDAKTILKHQYVDFQIDNMSDIVKAIKYALSLGKRGISVHLFIDEAHLFEKYEEIELIPRMGRKWGVYQVTISQRLTDFASKHKAVLTQSRYIVLFSLSRFELGVLRYYGLQDLKYKLPPHHFIVFNTTTDEIHQFKPIR